MLCVYTPLKIYINTQMCLNVFKLAQICSHVIAIMISYTCINVWHECWNQVLQTVWICAWKLLQVWRCRIAYCGRWFKHIQPWRFKIQQTTFDGEKRQTMEKLIRCREIQVLRPLKPAYILPAKNSKGSYWQTWVDFPDRCANSRARRVTGGDWMFLVGSRQSTRKCGSDNRIWGRVMCCM